MSTKKNNKQDRKKFWVRVLCIALAFLMISSALLAIFEVF